VGGDVVTREGLDEQPPADGESGAVMATVEITATGRPYLAYRYDDRRRRLVAERLEAPEEDAPFDRAFVPRTLTPQGRPLEVWVFGGISPMPGALATVRVVGLLADEQQRDGAGVVLLAALQDDGRCGQPEDSPEPPSIIVEAARRYVRGADGLLVLGIDEARRRLREDLERAARARAEEEKGGRTPPAWQARELGDTSAADPHTRSEREVLRLPYRFQKYVGKCLAPDERILLHVTRPPIIDPSAGFRLFGRRRLHEGLLVLTDQQVLFMEDAKPPDQTGVHWGYIARSAPPERLGAVSVDTRDETCFLVLRIETVSGANEWTIPFPADRLCWLGEAEALLGRFLPDPSTHALRRLYRETADDAPTPGEALDEGDRRVLAELDRQLGAALPSGESVLAEALAPGYARDGKPARLVAVTERSLWVLRPGEKPQACPLDEIGSLELRHSLLGSALSTTPGGGRDGLRVPFDGPAEADFVRLFVVARRLMANPLRTPCPAFTRGFRSINA
jgi:inorganic pyrophosphatase